MRRSGYLWARWIVLRALGVIFFSAFFSMNRQILGLLGSEGILPASRYLDQVAKALPGISRFHYAPSLFWINSSDAALSGVSWVGMGASVLLIANVYPRAMIAICEALFLSFIGVAQDFSSYQSDGMLLEAGFISIFLAPGGFRPGLGLEDPPSRLMLFLLKWEWFRIYFESGLVKLLSGDPEWRHLTAMDHYFENGPLPTWIGWYAEQKLPELALKATAGATLFIELIFVWLAWLPRRFRITCFVVTTLLQIGIIATANYAFLNYLVLAFGFLLLDDETYANLGLWLGKAKRSVWDHPLKESAALFVFAFILYATFVSIPGLSLPADMLEPAGWIAPFRIANSYGLFAVMTTARYEIEFQGSRDGKDWVPYPFRYKPQDPARAPGIYAPYQPRFDWNLWFASLGNWRENPWVLNVQRRLLQNSSQVLSLFDGNPFHDRPPEFVRTVIYQYWFTTPGERRKTGNWWRREFLGAFTPTLHGS